MKFLEHVVEKAKSLQRTIIFPEGTDLRTLQAVSKIAESGIAKVRLIGRPEKISQMIPLSELAAVDILNPDEYSVKPEYIDEMMRLRQHKGVTLEKAEAMLREPLYLGAMILHTGGADGMVAGAASKTEDVLRASFQIVQTAPGIQHASGAFIICLPKPTFGAKGVILFADCAINPDPTPEILADIAQASAQTARSLLGIDPRVALLSFSTKGSGRHASVDKVTRAMEIIRSRNLADCIDGEMQADAALVDTVAKMKYPGSEVAGKANVLIFPDLNSGNIAYKLVQRLAEAEAIGAITQGLRKPVNDLSRGCSVQDIIYTAAITALQTR